MHDTTDLMTLVITASFLLAGFVKGVIGLGLPTVAIGLLGLVMAPAQSSVNNPGHRGASRVVNPAEAASLDRKFSDVAGRRRSAHHDVELRLRLYCAGAGLRRLYHI